MLFQSFWSIWFVGCPCSFLGEVWLLSIECFLRQAKLSFTNVKPSSRIVDFFIKSRAIKLCSFCLLNKIILASLKYLGTLSWRRKSKTENNMKIHGGAIALCWGRCGAHFPWHRRLCFAVNYEWLLSWIRGFEGPFSNCESSVEAHKLCSFHFPLISRAALLCSRQEDSS